MWKLMFLPISVGDQYKETNVMHFFFILLRIKRASTCFEHYLLIFRMRFTNGIWYIGCV
jgi:hypothetical protein